MHGTDKEARAARAAAVSTEQWPGIDSSFRLIVVAAQGNKQLTRGALPRVEADPRRRRNTSIALEEVRRGLVPFTDIPKVRARGGAGDGSEADE
ncbi:MAG: DNA-directed RNA polymerase subunit omega [Acidobacteria bacterium]|nr:DNA-directed RNA polymerase subunit omega [Acidobacteriota bacterium]